MYILYMYTYKIYAAGKGGVRPAEGGPQSPARFPLAEGPVDQPGPTRHDHPLSDPLQRPLPKKLSVF